MTFKIGGMAPQQFESYLNPDLLEQRPVESEQVAIRQVKSWSLNRFSFLIAFIHRLSYFIRHQFSVYPNQAYLFLKFKSHQFSQIKEKEDYQFVKKNI